MCIVVCELRDYRLEAVYNIELHEYISLLNVYNSHIYIYIYI